MSMLTTSCFGDLWVNKVSVSYEQQLDLKNKYKPQVQLYRFGINGLISNLKNVRNSMPNDVTPCV